MSEAKEVLECSGETVRTPERPKASIIINNYNYGRYVADAIESALAQTFPNVEIIVVDDGSTDNSREVIGRYADRVITVFKENGGQASALNAGFARSRAEVVIFLDSDDMLKASALERAMPWFSDPSIVKVQWPLLEVDAAGRSIGKLMPGADIPDGDLREHVHREGPATIAWPATSGNAWSRGFLVQIFPIDERVYRMGADSYLFELAPFFGHLKTIPEPLSFYRRHDKNHSRSMTFHDRLELELGFSDHYFPLLAQWCQRFGVKVEPLEWRERSWWYRLAQAADDIKRHIPNGDRFVLIDDSAWAMDTLDARVALPFPEHDGNFAGPPADDADAIAELEKLRGFDVRFIVIGWPAFWWLDHYRGFSAYIGTACRVIQRNSRIWILEFAREEKNADRAKSGMKA